MERVSGTDALLADVSLYWFGNTLASSLRLYKENRLAPLAFEAPERVVPPLGVALFPRELPMPRGGHFAALEEPDLLVEDIRAFFRPMRPALETGS